MPRDAQGEQERDRVEALVEAYFERRRGGEAGDVESWARQLPGREAEFRELVDTLTLLESAASGGAPAGGAPARVVAGGRVGRFRLVRPIGRGGMGTVWEAVDDELARPVALKLLHGVATLEARDVERFRREALAAARLHHPRIVPIHAVGEDDGVHWLAMQFIAGESVAQRLRGRDDGRALPPPRDVARLGAELADALAYAHGEGILHRDVKPSNVLLDASGAAWLTDFGLAKSEGSDSITRTGEMVGTPRYMAPEAFAGWADPRTDVWGLGATLYELLAGRPAFDGSDRARLLRQIHEVEPPALRRLDPSLPRDLATIVHRCLQKEASGRYASAGELAADLRRFMAGEPIVARPPSLAWRVGLVMRRHPLATTLLIAALVAGAGATWREAARARAAEAHAGRRFEQVRKLAGSFLFEVHDAIRNLPGSTAARKLIAKRALEYLDVLAKERGDDAALRRELAVAYQKVGDVLGNPYQPNVGDTAGARASYATAIGLLEPVVASGRADEEDRALLATACLIGGGIDLVAGFTDAAIARSAQGLALREELAKSGDGARRLELATAWQYHAYNLATAGRSEEARAAIGQQAALLDGLVAGPGGVDERAVRRSRGQNGYLLAQQLQGAGDQDGARAAYDEVIALQRRLAADDPTNTAYRRDLAWTLNDRAIFARRSGDLTAAIAAYREALEQCEELARADSSNVDATLGVARARHNLASSLDASGERDEALRFARSSVAACEPVVAADPANVYAERLLARACLNVGEFELRRGDAPDLDMVAEFLERGLAIIDRHTAEGISPPDTVAVVNEARADLAECERRRAALSGSRQ